MEEWFPNRHCHCVGHRENKCNIANPELHPRVSLFSWYEWDNRLSYPFYNCFIGFWLKEKCTHESCEFTFYLGSSVQFSSVQSFSCVTTWIAARQASLSITNSRSLCKLMPIKSVMPSNHLILCWPLLLFPPIPLSIMVFSNELTLCMRWPKYWSFSFSISPSNEHPGLSSFKMDWLDLLAVQGTLKSLLLLRTKA